MPTGTTQLMQWTKQLSTFDRWHSMLQPEIFALIIRTYFFHFVQVPSAPPCRTANLTTATERSSSDPVNKKVTKRRTCSEMRAEYYDVPSDCRMFVTVIETRSAPVHFSDR
jgi:hypothetical protein